jgi:quercetin dioxygenase-like cupin family protein
MTIRKVFEELLTATHPVAKILYKGYNSKVLVIGFKKGMLLKEHKAHFPSKLTVLKGKVVYRQNENETILDMYDEIEIQVDVIHAVEALEESLCLLTQG